MMKNKCIRVSKSKYRVVISEILPYERPIFFSNRFFSRFLKYYGVEISDDRLVATKHKDTPGLALFLRFIGGEKKADRPCFQYYIQKGENLRGRCLSVIHPYHQVELVGFYDKYKSLLLNLCQKGHYSIRFPEKIATVQKPQRSYNTFLAEDQRSEDSKEALKHFFSYKFYKNINNFYDDYRFLRAEKQFEKMMKIDLKQCFENIVPESLSRAVYNHELNDCIGSVAYEFCRLQLSFKNSSSGIIIGPEFSRLYAEIILQKIDMNTEATLHRSGINRNFDYIFYRYVDDGFLYYSNDNVKAQFEDVYSKELKKYNLRINSEKTRLFKERPFLEKISLAKVRLKFLVDDKFQNRLQTFKGFINQQDSKYDTPVNINSKTFINEIRNILRSVYSEEQQPLKYKDISSFLFGAIQRRLVSLLRDFNCIYNKYVVAEAQDQISRRGKEIKNKYEKEFIDFAIEVVEVLFYLLSCDLRMSSSVKVVSIINILQLFVRGKYDIDELTRSGKFQLFYINKLDEKISDEISTFLGNSIPTEYNIMETLNILELEKGMFPRNRISSKVLTDYISKDAAFEEHLNFFVVFELIHFIKDQDEYAALNKILHSWISEKINLLKDSRVSGTEAVLTFLETMCCPWVDQKIKIKYAKVLAGEEYKELLSYAYNQKDIFIKWHGYKVNEAIRHIYCSEVY